MGDVTNEPKDSAIKRTVGAFEALNKEAKIRDLAKEIFIHGVVPTLRVTPTEAFRQAEQFLEYADCRWENITK